MVPIPGSSRVVRTGEFSEASMASAAAPIHSQSVFEPGP